MRISDWSSDVCSSDLSDQSLNASLSEDSEDSWQDFLSDTRPNPEEIVTGMRDAQTRSRWLAEALAELSPREQTIIRQRRLSAEGATLEELGRELGVSKERVRQLEHRALLKLRDSLSRKVDAPAAAMLADLAICRSLHDHLHPQ